MDSGQLSRPADEKHALFTAQKGIEERVVRLEYAWLRNDHAEGHHNHT